MRGCEQMTTGMATIGARSAAAGGRKWGFGRVTLGERNGLQHGDERGSQPAGCGMKREVEG
jgi:hypothetical protein